MISYFMKDEVCAIHQNMSRTTQTEALAIITIMRKRNPIVTLLCAKNQEEKKQHKWN